ncbi:Gfo/Idh/MocA family protein [Tardiphaga robiniae]|uniref:Oxidoreductase n=1 Tax=Tardiphaga robiniae TaxID=943830 RepID=A0A163XB13_9BRAD|nr:Gfo/Idh/MocA family oxidoreductase [Tardiphaga robiniae]KZD20667.1 oxidoreductase [Tardiphaga robiniae]
MRVVVIGLGVQGRKRTAIAGPEVVAIVDPVLPDAGYRRIEDVPLSSYDAALLCVPDDPKVELLTYLLGNGKHALVEKPLLSEREADLSALAALAAKTGTVCYTAYNHRFEPHFVRMRDLIQSGKLGEIYTVRMYYGNGTAAQVKASPWRDTGTGVLFDLGSHLLDTLSFWLGPISQPFKVISASRFENLSFDHVTFGAAGKPLLQLETSLLSWRNHFYADVHAEKGSAHITSLCKWGPSTFIQRGRVLPSGRPDEDAVTLVQADPTWALEYDHFKSLCTNGGSALETDMWISRTLNSLGAAALSGEGQ